MKILLSTSAPAIDAALDPRFGRCAYFLVVDVDTHEFQAMPNPALTSSGGAGGQVHRVIAEAEAAQEGEPVGALCEGGCVDPKLAVHEEVGVPNVRRVDVRRALLQLGDDQICAFDPVTRRVAFLWRGRGPVPVMEKAMAEQEGGPASGSQPIRSETNPTPSAHGSLR